MSNFCLFFYIALWIITLVVYKKHHKNFDVGLFSILLYLLFAFCSLFLFNSERGQDDYNELELFPFIYLFILLVISLIPIFIYSRHDQSKIVHPDRFVLNSIACIFIISTIARIPYLLETAPQGIFLLLTDSEYGADMYEEMAQNYSNGGQGDINLFVLVMNGFSTLGIFLFSYFLTRKKFNKIIFVGLSISVFIVLFDPLLSGSRTLPVLNILTMLATLIALRKNIIPKRMRLVRIFGLITVFALGSLVMALSISRFLASSNSSSGGFAESMLSYTGQAPLYFNNYGLDAHGTRNGDRILLLPKRLLGYNVPGNFVERRAKYSTMLLDDAHFSTHIGDFALDFGPILTFMLVIVMTFILVLELRPHKGKYYFHQLIALYYVITVCIQGAMYLYPFADLGGNLKLVVLFTAYWVFKLAHFISTNQSNQKKYITSG